MSEKCIKAFCPKCEKTFGVISLPCPVDEMSKAMMDAVCPNCSNSDDLKLDASPKAPDFPLPGGPDMDA